MNMRPKISWIKNYYVLILFISLVIAIANNVRCDSKHRVDWIGAQELLAEPEVLP